MNKSKNMKTIYVLPLLLVLFGCDIGKSTEKAGASPPATQPVAAVSAPPTLKPNLAAEAKIHFNQAFAYIGSAKAATGKDAKEKLMLNAEIELSNALEKDPSFVDAWLNRGVAYISLGKLNKAEVDLKKAIELDPKNNAAHYNLACLYSITKKLDLAGDSLVAALQNGYNNPESLRSDPDLAELRKTKEFRQILEKNKVFIN